MSLAETSIHFDVNNRHHANADGRSSAGFAMPGTGYEEILGWISPAPFGSALLGICADGFPLLLNLGDTGVSGLLLECQDPGHSQALFSLILSSAIRLNPREAIQASLVSPRLDKFPTPPAGAYEFSWAEMGDENAQEQIFAFAAAVEDRWNGRRGGILRLLFLDEVPRFFAGLDSFSQEVLTWAAAHASGAGCLVIASLRPGEEGMLPCAFRDVFGLHVFDRNPDGRARGGQAPRMDARGPVSSLDYFVSTRSGKLMRFRLPKM